MTVSRFLQSAAVLAVTTVVAACASTDYHYSQLSGTRYYRVPIDTYPVSIVRVDGHTYGHAGRGVARSVSALSPRRSHRRGRLRRRR